MVVFVLTFSVHAQADMASMQAYMYFRIFMSFVFIEWWCEVMIFVSDGQVGDSLDNRSVATEGFFLGECDRLVCGGWWIFVILQCVNFMGFAWEARSERIIKSE